MNQTPDLTKRSFARTHRQTILQRIALLQEFAPSVNTIAEICCGDCTRQFQAYSEYLKLQRYLCLDIDPGIAAANQRQGIACYCGDALDKGVLRNFITADVMFFGPPLSIACDGHQILQFDEVQPGYIDFARLLLGELKYEGMFVCICPNTTTLGDVAKLRHQVRNCRKEFNLPVIHYSYTTTTGSDEPTELRLKYIELWFSHQHGDLWKVRKSKP